VALEDIKDLKSHWYYLEWERHRVGVKIAVDSSKLAGIFLREQIVENIPRKVRDAVYERFLIQVVWFAKCSCQIEYIISYAAIQRGPSPWCVSKSATTSS
jgi:hypothetical protein